VARKKRPAKRAPLSRERIELAALDLIERDGLRAFSTRKLASELRCEAMSIYHHFPSKAHLMDALLDRVVGELELPPADMPWLDRLRGAAFGFRAMALRHPAFFQAIAMHRMNTRVGLGALEGIIGIFRQGGFDDQMTARLFRAFSYFLVGAALDETAGYAKGPSAVEPVSDEVVRREFPLVAAAGPYFQPRHHEATFVAGIDMLLEGIARRAPNR